MRFDPQLTSSLRLTLSAIALATLASLTACANFSGIASQAKPLDAQALNLIMDESVDGVV